MLFNDPASAVQVIALQMRWDHDQEWQVGKHLKGIIHGFCNSRNPAVTGSDGDKRPSTSTATFDNPAEIRTDSKFSVVLH